MSALAVKTYVQQQMALLDVPVLCQVFSQRPKEVAVGETAVIIVTIPQSREKRFTLNRGYGRKQVDHTVRLDIYWVAADEQQGGQWFDGLLWQIDHIFRGVTIPVDIADPDNGEQTVILFIGEDIETRLDAPLLDESVQGVVAFTAEKTLTVTEHLTG